MSRQTEWITWATEVHSSFLILDFSYACSDSFTVSLLSLSRHSRCDEETSVRSKEEDSLVVHHRHQYHHGSSPRACVDVDLSFLSASSNAASTETTGTTDERLRHVSCGLSDPDVGHGSNSRSSEWIRRISSREQRRENNYLSDSIELVIRDMCFKRLEYQYWKVIRGRRRLSS